MKIIRFSDGIGRAREASQVFLGNTGDIKLILLGYAYFSMSILFNKIGK